MTAYNAKLASELRGAIRDQRQFEQDTMILTMEELRIVAFATLIIFTAWLDKAFQIW